MPWLRQVSNAGLVEDRAGQDVHRVEPAAGLADVLDDEVAREVVLEPVLVVERVVHLRERHRARVEPHVEHVGDPAHRGLPGRVVGVGSGQLVDEGAVQVGLAVGVARQGPEVALDLLEGAVDVEARVLLGVGLPHRHRAAPEAVAGDRPVAGVLQPLAEAAVLDVLGHPADLLVELHQALLDRGHLDEPRRDALVDQGLAAAPAVRVGVVVGLAAQQHGAGRDRAAGLAAGDGLEVVDHGQVGVEDEHALVLRDREREAAVLADRHDRLDALAVGDHLVVLTERAGGVHQAGAVGGGDELGRDEAEGPLVAEVVGERRGVGAAHEVRAPVAADDVRVLAELSASTPRGATRR